MLENRRVREDLEKQIKERDKIEDEMLECGEQLTEVTLEKERKVQELADYEGEDEGYMLEMEEELDAIEQGENMIVETLESLDTTLDYVNGRINKLFESLQEVDVEQTGKPLEFKGLKSIEAARFTLKTFFDMVLDLNIYKKDLEDKITDVAENLKEEEQSN